MCSIPILHLPDMTASVYANPKLICAARTLSQVQLHCSSIHAIMQPECVKTKSNHAWPKYHILLKTSFPLLLHLRGTKIQSHGVSILK